MKRVLLAILFYCGTLLICLSAPGQSPSPPAAAEEAKHGVYPIAWREIVTRWLHERLLDPASARIEWISEPKPIQIKGRDGLPFFGYAVDVTVNSRNKFGMYTGKQARRVYIRNGEVAGGERAKSGR